MARLRRKNFNQPDELRPVGRGRLQVVEIGDVTMGRIEYQPGWRWSTDVKPLAGTHLCEMHHVGVVLSGRLHIEMEDGSSIEVGPLDAFEVPPGHDAWVIGDEPWISIDSVGRRNFGAPPGSRSRRILRTILFLDVVGSTPLVRRLGDAAWRDLLAEHNARARIEIERHHGTEVQTTGDGLLVIFDSPADAVRAARAIQRAAHEFGFALRAGVHTGEIERAGDDVRGIAVHHAARVTAAAGADEVLVSSASRVLLAGSGIELRSVGRQELKGIDEPDELYRVVGLDD